MEHLFFEVQLCIKISIFKEKHVFDILIILCLMTSLNDWVVVTCQNDATHTACWNYIALDESWCCEATHDHSCFVGSNRQIDSLAW